MKVKTIPQNAWQKTERYTDYPFTAEIPVENATSSMFPYAEFEKDDAMTGNYANVCESYDGGVVVFAKEPPEKDLKITVALYKGVI